MANSLSDDFGGIIFSIVILGLVLLLAAIITPIILIGVPAYVFYRLYKENPKRLERLARVETEILYYHALAGSVRLTDDEIETALSHHWPHDTPAALQQQLLQIGKALFEQEGLSPEIPPPPALCNTVEGARYRDMLARAGQARSDRDMVLSALEVISESLSVIAEAVPPLEGDVLVEVT